MKKLLFFIATILLSTVANNAFAATKVLYCNTCTTTSSLYVKAVNEAKKEADKIYSGFVGDIVVVNFLDNIVKGWNISAKWQMQGGDEPDLILRAYEITPSTSLKNKASKISNTALFSNFRDSRGRGFTVPLDSGLDSAWRIARGSINHAVLDNWYHNAYPITYWTQLLVNIAGSTNAKYTNALMVGIEITFKFADGSSVKMKPSTVVSGELGLSYVKGSAKDADGNTIADQGLSLSGEYGFSSEMNMNLFMAEALKWGISFSLITRTGGGYSYYVRIIDIH